MIGPPLLGHAYVKKVRMKLDTYIRDPHIPNSYLKDKDDEILDQLFGAE